MTEKAKGATLAAFLLLLCASSYAMGQIKPHRVAVISSSGVDGDFRSFHEYDGALRHLGWTFDLFRNTELKHLFEGAQTYDIILTTSLWNYGDAQDMRKFIPQLDNYLRKGGIAVLTDMAYPPMCDWLSDWDKGFFVEYGDASQDLGREKATLDLSSPSRFLTSPHQVGALNYWAHFRRWGDRYKVWAQTKGGTAVGLVTTVGDGVLIVTTAWALSPEMLRNVYANALALKSGIWLTWEAAPAKMPPDHFAARISIENLRTENVILDLKVFLRKREGSQVSAAKTYHLALPPKAKRTLMVALPCASRGPMEAVAHFRTDKMAEGIEVPHSFFVPPLVDLKLKRTVFLLNDTIDFVTVWTPAKGEKGVGTLAVVERGKGNVWKKQLDRSRTVSLPARKLGPGHYTVEAEVRTGSESGKASKSFEVMEQERPEWLVKVGHNGELLVNGKPFFPIGTYHVGKEDLKIVRDLNFNCVTGPIYDGQQRALTEDQRQWHDEAHRAGLWVISELSEYIRSGRRNLEEARQLVSLLRIHPATLAHYAIDEPQGGGISPELVRQFCQVLKEVDPDHPTFVNEVPGSVRTYADIADITGTDPYPIGSTTPESLAGVASSVREAVQSGKGRPVWAVIQAHRLPPPHSQNRYPTPEEIRCMSFLALNNGAKGLLFYAWGDLYETEKGAWVSGFKYSKDLQEFFRAFNAELREIGLLYALGKVVRDRIRITPQDSPVDAVWIESPRARMGVVVNPTSRPLRVTLTTPIGKFETDLAPFEVKFIQ